MSAWRIRSDELRRRRLEKMLGRAELSRTSGVSVRALSALEAKDKGVTVTTLDALTKALGCARADLATFAAAAKPTATPRATGERLRMSDLLALEEQLPRPAPVAIDGDVVPPLTALKYQQCLTAYAARDGERYVVEGRIASDRGLPPAEAALIGGRSGEAARFDVHVPIGDEKLAEAEPKRVRCVVRVLALRDVADRAGRASFSRERPAPWGFVVERVG